MIVKIEIEGDRAVLSTHPSEKPGVNQVESAGRLRCRFVERGARRMVGFFLADEATASIVTLVDGVETPSSVPLDILEIGDRVPTPKEAW